MVREYVGAARFITSESLNDDLNLNSRSGTALLRLLSRLVRHYLNVGIRNSTLFRVLRVQRVSLDVCSLESGDHIVSLNQVERRGSELRHRDDAVGSCSYGGIVRIAVE